jgi:UDP-N-acetylmuramate--alanine ligase
MVYFIGIRGWGTTALAQVMKARGVYVMGSDTQEKFMTGYILEKAHIKVLSPFDSNNILSNDKIEYAVVSGAYYLEGKTPTNPEVLEILSKNIPLLTYSQALGNVTREFGSTLAVAGSHGKSTTSALLTYTLQELGQNPFGVIGAFVPQFGGNARIGDKNSKYLVVEADEYQNHFLDLTMGGLIILNVDYDHPDFFETKESYYQAFINVIDKLPLDKPLIVNGDDENINNYILPNIQNSDRHIIKFGFNKNNNITLDEANNIIVEGIKYNALNLAIAGKHNRLNALSCVGLLYSLGYDINSIIESMSGFRGTQRRLEYKGSTDTGVAIIDDYAHHPTEIMAGIQALREKYPAKKIHCVFQPHTFSRTQMLLKEFGQALSEADYTYLLPIYTSARESIGEVQSKDIMEYIINPNAKLYANSDDLIKDLNLIEGDNNIIVTMGAGDVWKITKDMI